MRVFSLMAMAETSKNFIYEIIDEELAAGKHPSIVTRFPPEPNGYLHIGHAKSICLNHGIARDYQGRFHLRFDDTNPTKEDTEYVDSIKEDVAWLGADWGKNLFFASDYFEQLYQWALHLIDAGKAFVCELSAEEVREYRGTLKTPGRESPYRHRPVEENRRLFEAMRAGEFADGAKVLRAKIDMAHPNMNMRDPVLYRIQHAHHHRTGNAWCIYPMYDFAHGQSDAIEGITHSICTLEFEEHRPLYNWFIENLPVPHHPRQIEFARLNLTHTVMSKRKLLQLVKEGHVTGWDDPRMPTISGLRRRGYTPAAIREFCSRVGVAKRNNTIDLALLEFCLRQDLEALAPRRMAVLDPLKVTITNFPEGTVERFPGPNNPGDPAMGEREVPLTREIYIEREDFLEDPPKKFFRLAPGVEVRLRYACYITCTEVMKDAAGNITELRAAFDPESRGGGTPDNRRVKGTIHWVSATENVPLEVRLYENLFTVPDPDDVEEGRTFLDYINPASLTVVQAVGEPALRDAAPGERLQFERKGYFALDPDSRPERLVFNRSVDLRSSYKPE
ncbi:MAG: glutamine--tRNA ligase/YqeY domain fusion protein [Opitutales bacterium]|nr:glutamine--tRNA ligase/YqeY domain fusion protein [Opitutales bacterium]